MSFKFCANLNFMFHESTGLLERYSLAKKAGFKGVECATPYDYELEEVVESKKKAGLVQVLINSANWCKELGYAAIPGKEDQFAKSLDLTIKYAKALECNRVHIMSGIVQKPNSEHYTLYLKNLKYAASLLEKENITGLIEPISNYAVPDYYMNSYETAINVIENISSPTIKLQLDLFHLQHLKGGLTNNIKAFLPHVGHIQIAQVPYRNEPGADGEINYRYIFSLLQNLKYSGWIGLEYNPLNKGTDDSLYWINEWGYSL